MNRRTMISTTASAFVVPPSMLAPSFASAANDSAILRLYRRHCELADVANAWKCPPEINPDDSDRVWAELFCPEMDAVQAEIMALPCVGPADFAAKVLIASADGDLLSWFDRGDLATEARGLVGWDGGANSGPHTTS